MQQLTVKNILLDNVIEMEFAGIDIYVGILFKKLTDYRHY